MYNNLQSNIQPKSISPITGGRSWDRAQLGHVSWFPSSSGQGPKSLFWLQANELYRHQQSHGLCWRAGQMVNLLGWRLYCLRRWNATLLPENSIRDDNLWRIEEGTKIFYISSFCFVAANTFFCVTFIWIYFCLDFTQRKLIATALIGSWTMSA